MSPPWTNGLDLALKAQVQQGGQQNLLAMEELIELVVCTGCSRIPDTAGNACADSAAGGAPDSGKPGT